MQGGADGSRTSTCHEPASELDAGQLRAGDRETTGSQPAGRGGCSQTETLGTGGGLGTAPRGEGRVQIGALRLFYRQNDNSLLVLRSS